MNQSSVGSGMAGRDGRRPAATSARTAAVLAQVLAATALVMAAPPAAPEKKQPPTPTAAGSIPDLAPTVVPDRVALPAAGRHETVVTVSRFGRFAVGVESAQGTALRIVDRMAGPGETRGTTGEADGRLDLFLDRGEYKIITLGPEKGKGEARLSVRPFRDRSPEAARMLVEFKPVEDRLVDLEQISYALEIKERRRVILEAAGRDLGDLRLWHDASWLVDASPLVQTIEPTPGKRLTLCRLTADLEPGSYVVTAYGGPARPWGEETGEHPFYLRFGIPTLAEAGRRRFVSSPFGVDRFLVPARANLYRLELPEARLAALGVQPFDLEAPFSAGGPTAMISKSSSPPVAELEVGSSEPDEGSRHNLVTVELEAGLPYVLQHFERSSVYTFEATGDHWVSSIRTGGSSDDIDSTVLVVRSDPDQSDPQRIEPFLTQVVEVDGSHAWARRCNLLGPLSVYLRVKESGKYQVLSNGVAARFRIEPFLLSRPEGYRAPQFQTSGFTWNLDAGYYVLNVEPDAKGVLEIGIRPSGILNSVRDLLGVGTAPGKAGSPATSVVFPRVRLETNRRYTAYHNSIPEVKVGFVLRRLPLDLSRPLPVAQRAGETLEFPFEIEEPGTLRAEAEDGTELDIAVDGGPRRKSPTVAKGVHEASVIVAGSTPVQYSLSFQPLRLDPLTPLPVAVDTTATSLPSFPVLTEAAPRFFDLDRGASATFAVRAGEPGLYRLETTGLLATSGSLRTRMIPSFDRQTANGVGRNLLMRQYLREGDYQVTVTAQGASRGHLGIRLDRTPMADGGDLVEGAPARRTLAAGGAVTYRFEIQEAGDYRLEAKALAGRLRCRLEDEDGWPIVAPGGVADIEMRFEPGRYRLVVLPEAVATRTVTHFDRVRQPLRFEGHGPHDLPLGTRVEHVWLEPEGGGDRAPDVWTIRVPAAVDATIDLTGEMQGTLHRVESGPAVQVGFVPPGRGWRGVLDAGTYRLEATCSRRNNRAAYQIEARVEQLVAGSSRRVTAPSAIPIAVGRDGLVSIESSGESDVRARLYDSSGRLVDGNDDRTDDWNFQIATRLAKGSYRLQVDPVGSSEAPCTVTLSIPDEEEERPLPLPAAVEVHPGGTVRLIPLEAVGEGDVLLVGARSAEPVALAIEANTGVEWSTVGATAGRDIQVAVPTGSDAAKVTPRYRLRLWSGDARARGVRLSAVAVKAPRFSESQLRKGFVLRPVAAIDPPVGVAAVTVDDPGLFRIERADGVVRWSARRGRGCESADGPIAVSGRTLWIAADLAGAAGARTVQGTRVVLAAGAEHSIQFRLPSDIPVVCDLDVKQAGPVAVFANSTVGMPGVRVDKRSEVQSRPGGSPMSVGARSAVGVSLTGTRPVAVVWPALDTGEPIDVRLVQQHFARPPAEPASYGSWIGSISGFVARAFDLPGGAKRLRLTLGGGIVGVLSDGDEVLGLHWAGGVPIDESVESRATRLTILHLQKPEDPFSIEVLPLAADGVPEALAAGAPYERLHTTGGSLRLAVAPRETGAEGDFTLRVRTAADASSDTGEGAQPVFVGSDGRVKRGTDLSLGAAGGTLTIPHSSGLVLAWLDAAGNEGRDLWGDRASEEARDVSPPAVLPLSGTTQVFRLRPVAPSLVHIRAASPMLTRLVRGGAPPEVRLHPSGAVLDAYLPAGPSEIAVRAIAGGRLSGTADLTTTPVTPIGEGLGPSALLPAGGSRAFSFELSRKAAIGVGVRASSDLVTCTLLDSGGATLGTGLVQMATLEPGTYLLVVHVPENGRPLAVRPAIAGLEARDTGPPEDVIRSYLEKAGLRPAAAVASPAPGPGATPADQPEGVDVIDAMEQADEEGD